MFNSRLLAVLICSAYVVAAEELYPDKYDYIDVDEILANDRLREQYYGCFSGTGPCVTPVAKFFKDYIPEVIATSCRKCTERQKEMLSSITEWYTEKEPEKWNTVIAYLLDEARKQNIPVDRD